MKEQKLFWIPLDNAAKIFPAIRSKELTTVMRLTAILKEQVTISCLYRAVERVEKRFPYFKVTLRHGFFWFYLEQVDHPVSICHDKGMPCRSFDSKKGDKRLLRILVHKNRLSAEFSHILTDGYGLLTFFKTLLVYYFEEKDHHPADLNDTFLSSRVDEQEYEDAYNRYFKENIPGVIKKSKAFHLPFPLKRKPRFDVLYAILPIDRMKQVASEKGVSVTDYLVAVYLLVLQDICLEAQKKGIQVPHKIARIQVPVNLRNIYPTKTLRNFSLFVMPEVDFRMGEYTFDELLKTVYHTMRLETDEKNISKIVSRNVGSERNPFVRGIPVWLKNLVLYWKYYSEGTNQYSGVVTNLGKIDLPQPIRNKIDHFIVSPPPPNKKLKLNCGVIGYEDKLVLSFGNITKSRDFERRYLNFLTKQGIHIRITKPVMNNEKL
ncbi:MAG: hypothetical protein JEZ14_24835 [Marinilabiliaceae bacterium]|nr:hypothetical protein [Marinilabiliaceae bacterium]